MCVCVCVRALACASVPVSDTLVRGGIHAELDAAVLTPDGSFLTVLNQEPDKPLRFLLAMAPAGAGIAGGADGGGDLRGGCEPAALFGHNGAVIAPTAGVCFCILLFLFLYFVFFVALFVHDGAVVPPTAGVRACRGMGSGWGGRAVMEGGRVAGGRTGGRSVPGGETCVLECKTLDEYKCQEATCVYLSVSGAVRCVLASLTVVRWQTHTSTHIPAEGARERMRQYEEQGERFGDLFAQIPSVSELNMGPFVPERLDLRGIPGFGDDEEGALGQQGLGAVSPAEESHASASPTPPSSPQPESNV